MVGAKDALPFLEGLSEVICCLGKLAPEGK
jgi:hypothetical protein